MGEQEPLGSPEARPGGPGWGLKGLQGQRAGRSQACGVSLFRCPERPDTSENPGSHCAERGLGRSCYTHFSGPTSEAPLELHGKILGDLRFNRHPVIL